VVGIEARGDDAGLNIVIALPNFSLSTVGAKFVHRDAD
jgi:hypothetical protein